jgi:hypothetical protein
MMAPPMIWPRWELYQLPEEEMVDLDHKYISGCVYRVNSVTGRLVKMNPNLRF